jgi:polysaccharide export outer membrane protein
MIRFLLLLAACGAAAAQTRGAFTDITAPNLPAQRIGPDDLIAVNVYDAPEFTRTLRVGSDGFIRLPMTDRRIKAQGSLPADLETAIAAVLRADELVVDPMVTVTVVEYHSRPISVAGAVRNPVTFQAVGTVTLLDALTRAGGLSPEAGPELLVSYPQPASAGAPAALVQRIPVKGLIDAADPELNLRLTGGEEVRVPEAGKVFVVGNVKRPGAYALQDGAETSVLKILALAEGLAPYSCNLAYIYRRDADSVTKHEIPIPLQKIMQRKAPDVPLLANDVFYIPDNSGRRASMHALERILGFGTATASGVLVWRR